MQEPQAYLNGRFVPAEQASIPLHDAGFVQGVTVTEQLRTFGGRLFHVGEHFARLFRSLELVGLEPGLSRVQLTQVAEDLVRRNHPLLAVGDDLGVAIFVTPGPYRALAGYEGPSTVGVHTFPLAFHLWAEKYTAGERLATTSVQQVPGECWPAEIKCRSRMHYYLADREAGRSQPGARAVLTDAAGYVTETSTANVVVYRKGEGFITPPPHKVLPGISQAITAKMASELGLGFRSCEITPQDLATADEILLTSTPLCLLPVVELNGQPIGDGMPGPLFRRLMKSWDQLVNLRIVEQAQRFAKSR